ncbi:Leukocyte-associated immunoglobulin-like receptor 1 [Myotis brandtii]|nr:Leukocyte-associated immunoglobulin-like receptor 1 [Myotis brandtii]
METEILLCFLPGVWPKPSLRAEPGPVVPRGRPVTLVCRGPAGADLFRLEEEGGSVRPDQKSVSQDGSQGTEARFLFVSESKDTAGSYLCLYRKGYYWSERSEALQLKVTKEDVSTPPSGWSRRPAPCHSCVSVLGLPALLLSPSPGLSSLCTHGPRIRALE